ncbi:MAG: glycosyltransferase family 39 protein [Nitrospirota bacterium]
MSKFGSYLRRRADKKRFIPLFVFISLLCCYCLVLSTHLDGYERGFFQTALTAVTQHEFNMGGGGLAGTTVVDGKRYAEYVLESMLDVPLVGAGIVLDSLFAKAGMDPQLTFFLPKGLNALLTALTAMLLYLYALRIYKNEKTAVILAFIYGLATMALPYSTIGMDPLFVFLAVLGFYLIRRGADRGGAAVFAFAGFVFGLAMGAKTYAFLTYPFAALYLYLLNREKKIEGLPLKLALVIGGGIAGFIPYFWYNYIRFGSIIPFGRSASMAGQIMSPSFSNFLDSLYASFFSAGKSFFLYSPPLILTFWAIRRFFRKSRPEAVAFLSFCALIVLFFCTMDIPMYWADEVWGTRYYLVLVPFLVLPLGILVEGLREKRLVAKAAFYALVVLGFLVQIPGTIVYYGNHPRILLDNKLYSVQNAFYIPALSHMRMNIFLIRATITKFFTGDFPAFYYQPRSNIWNLIKFAPVQVSIEPSDYITVWWHQMLSMQDLAGFSRFLIILLVALLVSGFLFFGAYAYRLAGNKGSKKA